MDTYLLIFVISLLVNSAIACTFMFFIPRDSEAFHDSSVVYFRRYFIYSCLAYVSFALREYGPLILSVCLFNGLLLASAYSILLGALNRYRTTSRTCSVIALLHIGLFTLIQCLLAWFYPEYSLARVALIYVNVTGVLLYTLSLFFRFSGDKIYRERLLSVCLGVLTLSVFIIPIAYFASSNEHFFISIMLLVQNALTILLFGAFFYTFWMDAMSHVQRHVSIDLMTGLYNRQFFMEQSKKFLNAAKRHEFPITIVLCDLDSFRQINENYTHSAGDKAILHVAAKLKEATRDEDILARFSGEEFIALLPQTGLESSVKLAERLRHMITDQAVQNGDISFHVTASFGVAILNAKADIETSLVAVNKALKKSIEQGGNKVTFV